MVSIKTLYYGIAKAVKGICDKGYYQNRPKSVTDRPDSYIVISFPSTIYNNEIGQRGEYNDFSTTVMLEIYVRDKMSAGNPVEMNLNVMDEKVTAVMNVLPLDSPQFRVSHPRITLQTADDSGFHVTFIQADLRTK